MKFLICDEDLSSGKLCGSCQAKLVREELNQLEVETCKALFELTKTADLTNNELLKVREMKGGEFALVLVRGELGPLIGKHGKNLKQLIKSVGKKIRFVRYDQDNKAKISDLIKPLNLISISNIFESDSEKIKVFLDKKDEKKIQREETEKLIKDLTGLESKIEFI